MITHRLGIRIIGKASHDLWRVPTRYSNIRKDERSGEAFFVGQKMITQERLKELFHYDSGTGIFTRKVQTSSRAKIGMVVGCPDRHGHLLCRVDGKRYSLHRLAWLYVTGEFPVMEIDHISGEKSDNRFLNLREADRSLNMQNIIRASSNNKTGLLGVVSTRNPRTFLARIRVNGRNMHLGSFRTPQEAHEAYVSAKRQFHQGCTI